MRFTFNKFIIVSGLIVFSLSGMRGDSVLAGTEKGSKVSVTLPMIAVKRELTEKKKTISKPSQSDEKSIPVKFPNIFDVLRSFF